MNGPRLLGAVCVGLLAAAAALWGASQLVWFLVPAGGPGGRVVELTGAQAQPAFGGVALLALAGVAGVLAASGVLRRIVGVLLGASGVAVAVVSGSALFTDLAASAVGPLLAVLGGLLLGVAAVVVVVRERRLPRFGARYAAPERRPPPDPDRAAWHDLDAGRDPTDAEPPDRAG